MTRFSLATSWPVIGTCAVIWLAAAWLSWESWRRRGKGRRMLALEILRLLAVALLCFTLLRPEWIREERNTQPPGVAVLCDASASMKTRDVKLDDANIMERREWLEQRRQSKFWRPIEKNARVLVEDFAQPPPSKGPPSANADEGTDLNQALDRALSRDRRLKAVLVLTDGDWNLGKSPIGAATRFRSQNIPVFAVAIGNDAPLPDLVLQNVTPPSYGLLGEQISIPFKIQSHIPREVRSVVSICIGDREENRKEVTVAPFACLQDSILWAPREAGEFMLTLKLPVEKDESLADNNAHLFRMSVRSENLKVLVVESTPRWEYRFLRNALARDPGIEMQCLLLHPGMEVGGGRNYLSAFPGTKEALSKYDVIFLGDIGIGPKELTERDAELLKGLVEQQGSGIVFLPGRDGRQLTLLPSALGDLLPVVLDTVKPDGLVLPSESHLLLTGAGRGHLLTMLAADENRNQEIWKSLPGFFWCAPVQKSRSGSEVLAVHSSMRNSWGRIPLLITRPYGNGKTLFMGTDSAWRWRRGVEDKYHYRFWGQVVRWMAHQRHLAQGQGIRLVFSPEDPHLGETVFLQATVFDASGFPLEKGTVVGKVLTPAGDVERFEFVPAAGGWGVFRSSFAPQRGGKYKITVSSESAGRQLETEIIVTHPKREKIGQPANPAILREIADLTRGAFGAVADLDQIVQRISLLPEPQPVQKRIRLWCDPRWGGLILALLGGYWMARKLAGMV